jgi:DNA-binding transcriptional ArsR family regulator
MNTLKIPPDERITRIFRAISTPIRFRILAAIGTGEACVCHLETLLGFRQAYISQQLMDLRDAELLETRREGRYIFYRLSQPHLIDLLIEIGKLFGIPTDEIESLLKMDPLPQCCCPNCVVKLTSLVSSDEIITR